MSPTMAADGPGVGMSPQPADDFISLVRRLSYAVSIQDIMDVVTQAARSILKADGITFVLREGDLCHYVQEDAIGPLWQGQRFPMDRCISGWVMRNHQSVRVEDIYNDDRIPGDAYRPTFVRSLAMAPVRKDDPLAALGAYWRSLRHITNDEVQALEAIADAAALAVSGVSLRKFADPLNAAEQRAHGPGTGFLAALSHSLQQPLQTLTFLADVLGREPDHRAFRTALGYLDRELDAMNGLLDDLRLLTRVEAAVPAFPIGPISLADILRASQERCARLALRKGLRLTVPVTDAVVASEPDLLARIVGGLIEAVVRCTEDGDVRVECHEGEGRLRIAVSGSADFPSDGLDLLDEGGAGDEATASRRHPIVLRLVILQRLAAALGHELKMDVKDGEGICISVNLSLSDEPWPNSM